MSTILLSIKPKYSKLIFDGSKKFEFRKIIAKKEVDKNYSLFFESRQNDCW